MNNIRFVDLFIYAVKKPSEVFKLFEFSLIKVFLYFILLNLVMLMPLSIAIVQMDSINYAQFGFNLEEDGPAWLPHDLPDCVVTNYRLVCDDDTAYVNDFEFMGNQYEVYMNVPDDADLDAPYQLVFKYSEIDVYLQEGVHLQLDYRGFEGMNFAEVRQMDQAEGTEVMLNALFRSVHPFLIIPLIVMAVGGLMLMNIILIIIYSAISMLFRYLYPEVPGFKNMLKLFMIGSTIPAIINLILGLFGLAPFTSIVFNFMTPVMALWLYKKNRHRIDLETS